VTERILVTGAAGFIGAHLCRRLAAEGYDVCGLDWQDSPRVAWSGVPIMQADVATADLRGFATVVHLAAQAGVRHPVAQDYVHSNLRGFVNVLEHCKASGARLIYASSSSVYGDAWPQVETIRTDTPLSLYAATKKAGELLAHAYGANAIGLRFFTVYGPWGRPDMAPLLFARKILAGEPLELYNRGEYRRDFTYIDDVIEGLLCVIRQPLTGVYNIGRGQPVTVLAFVAALAAALGRQTRVNLLPPRVGEMQETCADTTAFRAATGWQPHTTLADGLREMVAWLTG
jgi:UDP-glucuronate 4-epimerase